VADTQMHCHSEGPGKAGEMGTDKPHQVQQREIPSPAPGEEQPQASVHASGYPAGKQLGRKGLRGPGGHQAERAPAMHPHSKGS